MVGRWLVLEGAVTRWSGDDDRDAVVVQPAQHESAWAGRLADERASGRGCWARRWSGARVGRGVAAWQPQGPVAARSSGWPPMATARTTRMASNRVINRTISPGVCGSFLKCYGWGCEYPPNMSGWGVCVLRRSADLWGLFSGACASGLAIFLRMASDGHLLPDEAASTVHLMSVMVPVPLRMTGE